MQIVVCHLTRMEVGYICVAGIDLVSGRQIRPLVASGRVPKDALVHSGGVFDIASHVDLGRVTPSGSPPEIEDHIFEMRKARRVKEYGSQEFWQILQSSTQSSLTAIFGPDLQFQGSAMVEKGKGSASLGCFQPRVGPKLEIDNFGDKKKLRILFTDGPHKLNSPVTDLRLYERDQKTPREELISRINSRIRSGTDVILGVGLTRPFAPKQGEPERHWFQVNALHLADGPVWTDHSQL